MYELTIEFYFEGLSKKLKKRKEKLHKANKDIFPADTGDGLSEEMIETHQNSRNKRVSKILNNKRDRSHPYLMSEFEVDVFVETLEYKNSKEMLWNHINWKEIYNEVLNDLKKGNVPVELRNIFYSNLIDYVPYAELHYYENTKFGKAWNKYTELEKDKIFEDAMKWCYYDKKEEQAEKLEKEFENSLKYVSEKDVEKGSEQKLKKFDLFFSSFLSNFLTPFLNDCRPKKDSLGQQVLNYQEEIDVYRYKYNELMEFSQGEETNHITVLKNYLDYSKEHVNKLASFQKELKEANIDII